MFLITALDSPRRCRQLSIPFNPQPLLFQAHSPCFPQGFPRTRLTPEEEEEEEEEEITTTNKEDHPMEAMALANPRMARRAHLEVHRTQRHIPCCRHGSRLTNGQHIRI